MQNAVNHRWLWNSTLWQILISDNLFTNSLNCDIFVSNYLNGAADCLNNLRVTVERDDMRPWFECGNWVYILRFDSKYRTYHTRLDQSTASRIWIAECVEKFIIKSKKASNLASLCAIFSFPQSTFHIRSVNAVATMVCVDPLPYPLLTVERQRLN